MRNPLARVRGLGSARDGTHHWWVERLTAVALIPLTVWFVISILAHLGAGWIEAREWIGRPLPAVLLIATIVATFHHAQLGLQVIVEDYVHQHGAKLAALLAIKGAAFLLGLLAVFSVLKIAFGG